MRSDTLSNRVRYKFDNFMARGGVSIFISLVVVFIAVLTVLFAGRSAIMLMFPQQELQHSDGYLRNLFIIFLEMTDPGNMSQDIKSSIGHKVITVLSGLSGVVMLSTLIAFLTTSLITRLGILRRGRSKVIERDHTLILGWNDQRILEIIRELSFANESCDNPVIVILADKDKEVMDDYLCTYISGTKNTRIVTRSGHVSSPTNLDIVSLDACRSVIVLATCHDDAGPAAKNESDVRVAKTVLAVVSTRPESKRMNVVAEVFLEANRMVVEAISPDEITTVNTSEILSKLVVQVSRSIGLSLVYSEIISFDGCEIYLYKADWGDVTFGEAGFRFPDGVPMGVRHSDGSLVINAPREMVLKTDDDLLVLAEDDSTIEYRARPIALPKDYPPSAERLERSVERQLIVGWTEKTRTIVEEYSEYVLEGSRIDILVKCASSEILAEIESIRKENPSLAINLLEKSPTVRDDLLSIEPFNYHNIIILSQSLGEDSNELADSETIIILLQLRRIFEEAAMGGQSISTRLVTEVLNSENMELIFKTGVKDVIVSNRFVSMLLAQISESSDIKRVYDDLFREAGSEIYLKPVALYFREFPVEVTFADMMHAAGKRGECCLGVKVQALEEDTRRNCGITLNPEKGAEYVLAAEDYLVVLALDET